MCIYQLEKDAVPKINKILSLSSSGGADSIIANFQLVSLKIVGKVQNL